MRFLGFNISVSRQAPKAATKSAGVPISSALWSDFSDVGPVLGNAYTQVVWVYRAINVLAEQVANFSFRFSRGSNQEPITTGALVDFYNRPHPLLNRFQYWELRVIWLMLRGECFRIPVFDQAGRLVRILMLDPANFEHIIDGGTLVGWRYRDYHRHAPLSSQVLLPEEVWHDRLPNPFDFWRGLSPLSLASVAAHTDYAASLHMKGIMENNGDAGLILRTSEQLDPEQREQLVAACRERKRRAGRADQPLLLWAGAEVITPKLASADAQFLKHRRYSCAEICAAFGVPEEIVTSTDTTKYDVMAGTRLNFLENRVLPLCRRLEAEEAVTVRTIDPNASGWFDVEDHPVLSESRRTRLAAAKTGFEMGIPFNALNSVLDLGFEPLPWGDTGFLPATTAPIERIKDEG